MSIGFTPKPPTINKPTVEIENHELPSLSLTFSHQVGDIEMEKVGLQASGNNLEECYGGIAYLVSILKELQTKKETKRGD